MDFTKLSVGKLFKKETYHYSEGTQFEFSQDSGASLIYYYNSPTKEEVLALQSDSLSLGICEVDNMLFVVSKFGTLSWADSPFTPHLSNITTLPEIAEGEGFALFIYLVDAKTGILKVIRLITLPNKLSNILKLMVEKQKQNKFDFDDYNKKLVKIYATYSTEDLVAKSEIVKAVPRME